MTYIAEISCFISVGQTAHSNPSFNATEALFYPGVAYTIALQSISPIQDKVFTVQSFLARQITTSLFPETRRYR